ncbi:hypothetical protein DOTSEDRAFT_33205 [Dothistroma septosporum NZE10]|uniref:Uncharacterized protein n=1 Tax=Dothistroma septosporum (strain NZE10 / CBS 128990) TaxID=675120 RepID=N1PUK2_DOTSN|nr:hypothetical protein DOTSEDRAFT_33205 [Dothistroma septosporum NZE10]
MLTCPPSRVNLTAADLSEFERRWAARRPVRSTRPPTTGARLSAGAAHLTKLGYVPASANSGRKRAEPCSSQATICTAADDDTPLAGPSRPVSQFERAPIRVDQVVGRDTISISDSIEAARSPSWSPQKPPAHFTLHEEPVLGQAETEARRVRNPRRFRRAAVDTVLQHLVTTAPELVRSTDAAYDTVDEQTDVDSSLNPSLDPGAPVFVPGTRFGTIASHSPDSSHGGIRLDGVNTNDAENQAAHLHVRLSSDRNSRMSSYGLEQDHAASSRPDTTRPARLLQARRRSRTHNQDAAVHRTIPDLDRYPAMPTLPPGVGTNGRRSIATHRRVVLPRRRSSRAHLVDFERARMAQTGTGPASPAQRGELREPDQDGLPPLSPAPSPSSRSTPNLLLQGISAPVVQPRSSSVSWNRTAIPEETQPSNKPVEPSFSRRASGDDFVNRDSPLEELVKQLSRLVAHPRSVGRSLERPPSTHRPSLLNGDPFRLDSRERSSNRSPMVRSPSRQGTTTLHGQAVGRDAVQQAIEKYQRAYEAILVQSSSPGQTEVGPADTTVHRSQTQSSLLSALEDPVALALALPPETVPLSPASTPLPSSPGSPRSAYMPSTPPVHSPTSPRHSSISRSSIARSSINRIPQSLDAAMTPKVTIYNDDKSPAMQPQTPADVSRTGRRFHPRSDVELIHRSTPTASVETTSHVALERNFYRDPYHATTPSHHDAAQYDNSGLTPARQSPTMAVQGTSRVGYRRRELSENEMEPHLSRLEQDRHTWISRQEYGTLDVTPPREGRYERYLS